MVVTPRKPALWFSRQLKLGWILTYNVCPITLPILVFTSSRDRLTATTITVSHLDLDPVLDDDDWLSGPSTSVSTLSDELWSSWWVLFCFLLSYSAK